MVRLGFLVKQASEDLESPSVQVSIVKVRDGVYKITENYSTCSRIYQVNNYGINGPFQFQANDGILKGFLIDGKIHGIAHLIVEGTTKETIKGIFVKGQELPASGFRYSTPTNQKSGAEEEIHAWHVDGFKWLDMPINNHLAAGIWGRSSWTATTSNWPNMTIGIATSTYTTSNYTTTITS